MMKFWELAWERHWATLEQMKLAVEKGFITAEQFEEIIGEAYEEDDADESTESTGNH